MPGSHLIVTSGDPGFGVGRSEWISALRSSSWITNYVTVLNAHSSSERGSKTRPQMSQSCYGCTREDERHWIWAARYVWALDTGPCALDVPFTDAPRRGVPSTARDGADWTTETHLTKAESIYFPF